MGTQFWAQLDRFSVAPPPCSGRNQFPTRAVLARRFCRAPAALGGVRRIAALSRHCVDAGLGILSIAADPPARGGGSPLRPRGCNLLLAVRVSASARYRQLAGSQTTARRSGICQAADPLGSSRG